MNDNHPQNHSVDSYGLGLSNPKLHSVTGSHRTRNQYNPLCVAFFCHPLGSFQKRRIYLKLFFRIEIIRRWFYVYIYIYFWYINIISVQNNIHKYIYISYSHIRNRWNRFYFPPCFVLSNATIRFAEISIVVDSCQVGSWWKLSGFHGTSLYRGHLAVGCGKLLCPKKHEILRKGFGCVFCQGFWDKHQFWDSMILRVLNLRFPDFTRNWPNISKQRMIQKDEGIKLQGGSCLIFWCWGLRLDLFFNCRRV